MSKKMATTTTTTTGRRLRPPSPNIDRSRSITSSISLPVSLNASFSSSYSSSSSSSPSNSSKRVMISRSQSTTRSSRPAGSNPKSGEMIPARNSASRSLEVNNGRSREAFARYLEQRERGSPLNYASSKGVKPGANSPSAWALSPGRVSMMKTSFSSSAPATSMCQTPPESPVSAAKLRNGGGGAVAGVLKYFKAQKKVSPVQEEDYHRFRVYQNRLLQLRFINAKTEAAMANLKINVEVPNYVNIICTYHLNIYIKIFINFVCL